MDPISLLGSTVTLLEKCITAINSIYHLRLELRNTPEYIEDIRSNLANLQTKIKELYRLSNQGIPSQDNFESRAANYATFNQKIGQIRSLLSNYQKNGGGLFGALVFRFGPKAESKAKIEALHTSARELVQVFKRIHLSQARLSMIFPQRGEPQTADDTTSQLLLDQISESLASAVPVS